MKKSKFKPVDAISVALVAAGMSGLFYYYNATSGGELEGELKNSAQQVEEEWKTAGKDSVAEEGDAVDSPHEKGDTIGIMKIPAWGEDHAVPIIEGAGDDQLSKGVGRYESTVLPGEIGNFAVAGHRSGDPQPFRGLLELGAGEEVIVETKDATYIYEVTSPATETTVLADDGSWVLHDPKVENAHDKSTITLTTCTDIYLTPERSILFGELKQVKEK